MWQKKRKTDGKKIGGNARNHVKLKLKENNFPHP